jgi:hypothetical protein
MAAAKPVAIAAISAWTTIATPTRATTVAASETAEARSRMTSQASMAAKNGLVAPRTETLATDPMVTAET